MIYRDAHEAGKRIYEPDQYALLYLLERDAMGRSFLGEVAEAEELLREALRGAEGLRPADRGLFLQSVHWDLARCRLAVGDRDGALAFLQTPRPVERSSDGTCGACEWDGAVIASLRGNREEALRHLRAVLTRWPLAMYAPEHDPLFQDLHGDPRFHELLASVRHPYMRVLF